MLWPESEPEQAVSNINTATTKLRKVLQSPTGQCLLVTEDDAAWYRLEGQDLVWADVEAALGALHEAEGTEDALPMLEQVEVYLGRGRVLEEADGLWISGRRAMVDRARHRCRLLLSEAYRREKKRGQAEAILSLLLEEDPTDEDVACRLMELLHLQGMTHQARLLYKQTCQRLEEEGLEPT